MSASYVTEMDDKVSVPEVMVCAPPVMSTAHFGAPRVSNSYVNEAMVSETVTSIFTSPPSFTTGRVVSFGSVSTEDRIVGGV